MGALQPAGTALFIVPNVPPGLALPLVIVAGFIAGAAWGVIPALLKAWVGVNEIITTLMMNYIAILWIEHLFYGPGRTRRATASPAQPNSRGGLAAASPIPRPPGPAIAIVAAVFIWLVLSRTKWGYETASSARIRLRPSTRASALRATSSW